MDQKLVQQWEENKQFIQEKFEEKQPASYKDIVSTIAEWMPDMSPDRVTQINYGDYQGTLVFVIGESGYQPLKYWTTRVSYGSCSGCDTLQRIREDYDEQTPEEKIKDYMTLALHLVQRMKEI